MELHQILLAALVLVYSSIFLALFLFKIFHLSGRVLRGLRFLRLLCPKRRPKFCVRLF